MLPQTTRRTHFKKAGKATATATLVTAFALLLPVSQAQAASTMNWDARFRYGLDSREVHTSGGGTIKVTASAFDCDYRRTHADSMKIRVELQHMSWIWNNKGSFVVNCGSSGSKSWTNMPKGSYRLHLSKVDDGGYVSADGKITYP